jgi:hypothetical protein
MNCSVVKRKWLLQLEACQRNDVGNHRVLELNFFAQICCALPLQCMRGFSFLQSNMETFLQMSLRHSQVMEASNRAQDDDWRYDIVSVSPFIMSEHVYTHSTSHIQVTASSRALNYCYCVPPHRQ